MALKRRLQNARRKNKKNFRSRARGRRGRRNHVSGGNTQYARIVETGSQGLVLENTTYTGSFNIDDFPRAKEMAKLYQFYRPKVVTYKYIPLFNTFQEGFATGYSVPQMLMLMNRCGMIDNFSRDDFLKMGSVPRSFTKPSVIRYRPNLVQALQTVEVGSNAVYNQGLVPVYNWVQTYTNQRPVNRDAANSNTLVSFNNPTFLGHEYYFDVDLTGGQSNNVAKTVKTVVWEFKQPRWPSPPAASQP